MWVFNVGFLKEIRGIKFGADDANKLNFDKKIKKLNTDWFNFSLIKTKGMRILKIYTLCITFSNF